MSIREWVSSLCALLLLTACADPPAALRVGEVRFTREEVEHLSPERRAELADLAALSEAIRENRLEELVAPIAERAASRERVRWLGRALAGSQLGEDELARRYSAAPDRELRVRHVLRLAERGAPPELHERARRVAEEVRGRAAAGEPFEELVAEFSEEPGAERRGGLLDWGREGSWVEPFWRAASALDRGELSPVVQTVYGYHVLLLEEERPIPARLIPPATLLRRTVSEAEAESAFQAWTSALEGELTADPPAILQARAALQGGGMADSVALVGWPGGAYLFRDLLKDLALLDLRERERLLSASEQAFGNAVMADARSLMWLAQARAQGVALPAADPSELRQRWSQRAARWGEVLGISGGELEAAPQRALRALSSTGQEARLARLELAGIRFRLRELYPPEPSSSESE